MKRLRWFFVGVGASGYTLLVTHGGGWRLVAVAAVLIVTLVLAAV